MHRAIEAGLDSVCGDERLKSLYVHSVEPCPFGSKLLVILMANISDPEEIISLEHSLRKASGLLRSAVAGEINRKRTPHLTFRVVPEI